MNLPEARRRLHEMQAAHTEQPDRVALSMSDTPPNLPVLEEVLEALSTLDDPRTQPRIERGPFVVAHPMNPSRAWTCGAADVEFWRAADHTVTGPLDGRGGSDRRPFTLPTRARQTFGDVA